VSELNEIILGYLRTTLSIAGAERLLQALNRIPDDAARLRYAAEFGLADMVDRGDKPAPMPAQPQGPARQMRLI
jgi:hypothetical protein